MITTEAVRERGKRGEMSPDVLTHDGHIVGIDICVGEFVEVSYVCRCEGEQHEAMIILKSFENIHADDLFAADASEAEVGMDDCDASHYRKGRSPPVTGRTCLPQVTVGVFIKVLDREPSTVENPSWRFVALWVRLVIV